MWDLKEYCSLLSDALKRNETIVFGCRCAIRYSGRAESHLAEGDRIIMIKGDNTLLVHQPSGNNPINYMKANTSHEMNVNEGKLVLKSNNVLLKEKMTTNITRIHFFNSHKLEDGQSILVQGTEADIIKLAMVRVDEYLKKENLEEETRLLLQVHDELVYEIRKDKIKDVAQVIRGIMESVVPVKETSDVPLLVEVKFGKNWGEMTKI